MAQARLLYFDDVGTFHFGPGRTEAHAGHGRRGGARAPAGVERPAHKLPLLAGGPVAATFFLENQGQAIGLGSHFEWPGSAFPVHAHAGGGLRQHVRHGPNQRLVGLAQGNFLGGARFRLHQLERVAGQG